MVSWFFTVFGWFPWFFKLVSRFLDGSHGFQGGFMVFYGFWLVSMVFQGNFMVFHALVGFHGFSRWFHGSSWFLVGFHVFSRWFHGFFMVFG